MSGIYEEPKQPARNLRPYPYEEPGVEVSEQQLR